MNIHTSEKVKNTLPSRRGVHVDVEIRTWNKRQKLIVLSFYFR